MTEATVARPAALPSGLGFLVRVVSVPMLGFVAFGVGLAIGIPSDRVDLFGLMIVTATLILTVVAVDRSRPRERRNLLLTIFSFSYFCFFVVPVLAFYLGDEGYTIERSPSPIRLTPIDVTRGMFAALVGYALLLAGYVVPIGAWISRVAPRMKREWSAEAAIGVALISIPLGWAVILGHQFGLIPARAGSGVLGAVGMGASFGIGLLALAFQRYRSKAALLLLILVSPPTMMFNFFTASKMLFLMPLVMIAIVHVIVTRQLRLWWIVGFVLVMAAFYPIAKEYREYMYASGRSAVQVIASPQGAFHVIQGVLDGYRPIDYMKLGLEATASRLQGLDILSTILRDAGTRVPFQGGWSLAYIPIAYVPRLFWPGKPALIIGGWVTENFCYPGIESSTGSTWMGELYFNFGWLGIVVGMILLGIWFRVLQESFLGTDATIPSMLAGVVTIWMLATGVGGDLLGPTNTVIFNVAPIFLMHLLVRTMTPPPARMPPPL